LVAEGFPELSGLHQPLIRLTAEEALPAPKANLGIADCMDATDSLLDPFVLLTGFQSDAESPRPALV